MATTYIDFKSPTSGAFSFKPTLDGALYNATVTWNIFGQRWYLNIFDSNSTLVLTLPMVGSPADYDISLTAGYFTTKIVYRIANSQIEVID
ncbi:phage baseplate plug family protein [Martelella alba]|uniref:Cyanophage baseplate Pam3 plug gp18 domain-containing protein n=1 Tax=Martelella alba TaxID=2590451 RepID=A0ABY2SQU1_9HYPH|nr:hypothetical protein [Martelella alba]TKI08340.1 hypothetical protein FCN80_04135 [Martelella alba]